MVNTQLYPAAAVRAFAQQQAAVAGDVGLPLCISVADFNLFGDFVGESYYFTGPQQ